ncbi:MAG: carboxypeptidase regulatory-like domain-containing protein [Rubricoccaceae bacterium]
MPAFALLSRSPCRPAPWALLALVLTLFAAASAAHAQTTTLRGFVTDAADGQPLPGVNVALVAADGAVAGAATSLDGVYTIPGLRPGRYVLRASFVGYGTRTDTLTLAPGVRTYSFALAAEAGALGEVRVESERTAGAASVTAGLQRVRPGDIREVPAPDVSGDLANYLVTLPGVVATGDQGGQLFIRGGEPTQNQVRVDGIPVYQPFHVLGFYSAFPTEVVANADVYAGGYGARYGGQLSSVLAIDARTGNKRRVTGSAAAAPFVNALSLEGPLVRDRVSVLAHGRLSAVEQVAGPVIGRSLPYRFGDVFAKVHAVPAASSQLSATALYTFDRGTVGDTASVRADEVRWDNAGLGVRYVLLPADAPLLAEVVAAFSRLRAGYGTGADARASGIDRVGVSFDLTYFAPGADVRFGGELEVFALEAALGGLFSGFGAQRETYQDASFYAEPELRLAPGLRLSPGLRVTTSPSKNLLFLEPRLRAVAEAGQHRLSAAGGLYHQTLVGLSDRRDATSLFTAWTSIPLGEPARAVHALAGYRLAAARGPTLTLDLAVEGFYKVLSNLSVAEWTATPQLTTRLQQADGRAAGGDVRLEARRGAGYLSLNYGLAAVRYTARQPFYELWFGEAALDFRPPHDRRHQVSVVAGTEVAGVALSARWQFGSGLPFSRALGFDRFIDIGGGLDPLGQAGAPRVIYERPYNAELPAYHRLDLSAERTFRLGPSAALTAQAGLVNAYDRRNLFAFDTFTLRRSDQLPLVPVVGIKLAY